MAARNVGRFVTRSECRSIVSQTNKDLELIKRAVVGPDMRGGIVADMAEVKNKLAAILENRKEQSANRLSWKIAWFATFTALATTILEIALRGG